MIEELIKYQKWRTGEIDASLGEIGLTPAKVTACINWAIESLTTNLAAHDAEVAKSAFIEGACAFDCDHALYPDQIEDQAEAYAAQLRAKASK